MSESSEPKLTVDPFEWLTPAQVADWLHVSQPTLEFWRRSNVNKGPQFYKFGSLVRYHVKDVRRWAEARRSSRHEPAMPTNARN